MALETLVGDLCLHLSWETDDACLAVMAFHFPDAFQRGDLLQDDPRAVARLIKEHDPEQECLVIAAAGPPCPDFSVVNNSAQSSLNTTSNISRRSPSSPSNFDVHPLEVGPEKSKNCPRLLGGWAPRT